MRILPMGRSAVLVDEIGAEPDAWANGLRALELAGVVDVVPAARTVLVACADEQSVEAVRQRLADVRAVSAPADAPVFDISVHYDGPDLADVGRLTGLTVEQVVAYHSAAEYTVAFCGFAPGFAYLRGLDRRLMVPRRETPRTQVAPGSVAIAAGYSAVYPRQSPGGWHVLGHTDAVMFDPDRQPPVLLAPGAKVRFRQQ